MEQIPIKIDMKNNENKTTVKGRSRTFQVFAEYRRLAYIAFTILVNKRKSKGIYRKRVRYELIRILLITTTNNIHLLTRVE